jgi:hypothetical protein
MPMKNGSWEDFLPDTGPVRSAEAQARANFEAAQGYDLSGVLGRTVGGFAAGIVLAVVAVGFAWVFGFGTERLGISVVPGPGAFVVGLLVGWALAFRTKLPRRVAAPAPVMRVQLSNEERFRTQRAGPPPFGSLKEQIAYCIQGDDEVCSKVIPHDEEDCFCICWARNGWVWELELWPDNEAVFSFLKRPSAGVPPIVGRIPADQMMALARRMQENAACAEAKGSSLLLKAGIPCERCKGSGLEE